MSALRKRKGFTLVEIMIVVAIISLLAAIAIPNLLRARHNANEAAAIGALRTISTASESFRAAQSPPSYPASMAVLSGAVPPYIDTALGAAIAAATSVRGYWYTYTLVSANQYNCCASPAVGGTTGTRFFYVDESGVIRTGASCAAAATGAVVE